MVRFLAFELFSPASGWVSSSQRQKRRIFHRAKTGIELALSLGLRLRFLTLTTYKGYDVSRLSKDLQVLRKRLEHANFKRDGFEGFHMEYCGVYTDEGNGVLHLLYVASELKHRFKKATLDNLPKIVSVKVVLLLTVLLIWAIFLIRVQICG